MQGITTFLSFESQAEEAANFYVSIFPNSRILNITRVPAGLPPMVGEAGSVLVVDFELDGRRFTALNASGPDFAFTQGVSLLVECETQAEVDRYWDALLAGGGKPVACGWLTDRFGLSWQVTPVRLLELISSGSEAQRTAAMLAMMEMVKLELAPLEAAAESAG